MVSTEPEEPKRPPPRAPDLSPVEAPADLFIVDRYANPRTWIDEVAGDGHASDWLRLPCISGRPGAIDTSGTVDEVAILDERSWGPVPQWLTAVSVGLAGIDARASTPRLCGLRAEPVKPGVHRLVLDDAERSCLVAAAAGPATTRLVCGPRRAVDRLWSYLVRGISRDPPPASDRHFAIDLSVLHQEYEQRWSSLSRLGAPAAQGWLQGFSPRLEEALTPRLQNLAAEGLALASNLERLNGDVRVGGNARGFEISLKLKARTAWTVRTMLDLAQRSQGAPELFWRLPGDSEGAWFTSNINRTTYEQALATLSDSLHRFLGAATIDRATAELMVRTFLPQRPTVYAHGAVAVRRVDDCSPQLIRNAAVAAAGWHLVGFSDRSPDYRRHLVAGMKAYNQGQLRALAYRQPGLCQGLPKIRIRPRPPPELPSGSTVFEMAISGHIIDQCFDGTLTGRPPTEGMSYLVILVEHGEQTWIGFSGDERTLVQKLAAVTAPAPSRNTLGVRNELRSLMQGKPWFGGLITRNGSAATEALMRMFLDGKYFTDPRRHDASGREAYALAVSADPAESTVTLRVRVPPAPAPVASPSKAPPDCRAKQP